VSNQHQPHAHAPGYRAIRWNMDWITRPLFGFALAGIAILALSYAPEYFAGLIVAIAVPAAYEWHRMVGQGQDCRVETAVTSIIVALSVLLLVTTHMGWPALLLVAAGAVLVAFLALRKGQSPLWQALGVAYLGVPVLALASLRIFPPRGALVIIGLLLIVWATDTGALIFGNLIGGPRMAPKLSPSKTWAGTIGGSLTAAIIFSLYILLLGGSLGIAALFAFVFSATAHAGDLFESFVKRHFGLKNSGTLIPGHGGVLDRIDSSLAAGLALAILMFVFHFNPLFGVAS